MDAFGFVRHLVDLPVHFREHSKYIALGSICEMAELALHVLASHFYRLGTSSYIAIYATESVTNFRMLLCKGYLSTLQICLGIN